MNDGEIEKGEVDEEFYYQVLDLIRQYCHFLSEDFPLADSIVLIGK
jgi:hypothetical protein